MTTGEKIYECRKRMGLTQEELAERLGVTRQAVSRWEQDITFPETKQIVELCKLFGISSDELLFGESSSTVYEEFGGNSQASYSGDPQASYAGPSGQGAPVPDPNDGKGKTWGVIDHGSAFRFEYISKRRLFGMPLVHIYFGPGRAHGVFAVGLFAAGFFSVGIFAMGFVSLGVFALGLLAAGSFVLGGAAFGAVALGLAAFGGLAVGLYAMGGLAIGQLAVGGLAIGQFAVGDHAYGWLAVGLSRAQGAHPYLIGDGLDALAEFLKENVSAGLGNFVSFFAAMLA